MLVRSGAIDVVVVDSVAALVPVQEILREKSAILALVFRHVL